jgi:hypothetical protein
MKVTDILTNLPIGEIIPKRVLAVLKRSGLIYDYSHFGYLEGQWIYYINCFGERERTHTYAGKEPKANELGSMENPFPTLQAAREAGYVDWIELHYKGFTLKGKYLSGCFNQYLIKADGETANIKKVERNMVVHLM